MPTTKSPNAKGNNNSGSGSNAAGFSLMSSLKGGAGSVSGTSDADSTARLREGLSNSTTQQQQQRLRSPTSPMPAPHPIRATRSFTSSSNHNQQQQQQMAQQLHQRRSANYRNVPKKSPHNKQHKRTVSSGSGTSGSSKWNFPGLSPANSMDSEDQLSSKGGGGGGGSIYTTQSAVGAGQMSIQNMTLQTASFDDCYSPKTPGFHDAFTLLDSVEKSSANAASITTPSPRSKNRLQSFLPSSPKRVVKESPSPKVAPASPTRKNRSLAVPPSSPTKGGEMVASPNSASSNNSSSGLRKKAPTPLFTQQKNATTIDGNQSVSSSPPAMSPHSNNNNNIPTTPTKMSSNSSQSNMPAPPSNSKSKQQQQQQQQQQLPAATTIKSTLTTTARSASPMRAPSPLGGRMKSSISNTWNKAKKHTRSHSKGSGNYSDAVAAALQEESIGGREVNIIAANKLPKSNASGRSGDGGGGGFEVISGPGINGSRDSPKKKRGGGSRLRNRSPSPVRHLGERSPLRNTSDVALSLASGSKDELDKSRDELDQVEEVGGNNINTATAAKAAEGLHMDKDSTASTPSFFGGTRGIRAMSPGRMKRSLKKRLAIPSSSSSMPSSAKPPASPEKPPLHLGSDHGTISNKGSVEEDETGFDDMVTSLAHTTMSFDVDDRQHSTGSADSADMGEEPQAQPQAPIQEESSDMADDEGYYINTTSFNIFESNEFLKAMGGSESEASLATNYIRTGDSFCHDNDVGETEELDRAIQVYYAGLGAILTRVKEWSLENHDRGGEEREDVAENVAPEESIPDASHILYKDFVDVAHCPETNVLLLAMSSILLRSGNTHFRLKQYESACRDYISAQSYRALRHEAKDLISKEKLELNNVHMEDSKLNGRISNNMASALSKQGKYEEARSEYTKALQIKQGSLETLHKSTSLSSAMKDADDKNLVSDIASTFHNIGLLRMNCGEPKKAEKAYKQSLSLRVKKFGLDDVGVSSTLSALGDLYYNQKQHDDAFRSYKESLRIWKSHIGRKSDLKTAEHYYNIGLVFYSKGPYNKAKSSVAECLRIRRQEAEGEDSLPVAAALYLLGLIATSMGNYGEALSLLEEALDIRRRLLKSGEHLLLLNVQLALGIVYRKRLELDFAMNSLSAALLGRTQRLGRDHVSVSEVLQAIGDTYNEAQEYTKAFKTLEEALRIRKTSFGSSLEVAETLNSLSLVLFKSGDTEKAIELSEEAHNILKSAVNFNHNILVARTLKNTGDYYQDMEAYDDAAEAYNVCLRVMTGFYGRDHVLLSEVLNEMGVTRFKNGDYNSAKESFTEALRLMRLNKNEDNQSAIFPTLNHLGHALYKSNELKLAASTYIESFNIQVSIVTGDSNDGLKEFGTKLNSIKDKVSSMELGEEDVTEISESLGGIASILRYLGLVIQEQGDFEAALSANKLSLSVRLCQPFKEHAAIALMAETIAMFEYKRNNLESAMDYFNQALDSKKSFQGDSTIDVARTVNNLANIHFSLGNLDEAMELYQEALEIKKLCLGDDSDEVANTLNNIAHVMVNAGKEQEALEAYHNVVKIRQDRYGKSHISVAATLASMGDVYIKLGKLEIARTYFEQCIRIQKHNQGHCDERVLENLGSIYGKLGEWHDAESTFKEIIDLKREAHGDDCLDVAKTLDLLAVSYIEQNRYADSIEHLQEALRIRKACLDDEDDEVLASLNKLAFVYKSLDMTDQMLEVRGEFESLQARRRNASES